MKWMTILMDKYLTYSAFFWIGYSLHEFKVSEKSFASMFNGITIGIILFSVVLSLILTKPYIKLRNKLYNKYVLEDGVECCEK